MSLSKNQGPYAASSQEDRAGPRAPIAIPARLRPAGGRPVQTMVNDLSLSGFSATSIQRLHPGTICWLTLPGLESMQAEVVWWDRNMCGCAFARLLSPQVYDSIMQRGRSESFMR